MEQNYKIHTKETTIRVLNTEVSAVRRKDIVKKASRVIENGLIGIAGSIGEGDDEKLLAQANENLTVNIPYPHKAEVPNQEGVVIRDNTINHETLLENVEKVLKFLRDGILNLIFLRLQK